MKYCLLKYEGTCDFSIPVVELLYGWFVGRIPIKAGRLNV